MKKPGEPAGNLPGYKHPQGGLFVNPSRMRKTVATMTVSALKTSDLDWVRMAADRPAAIIKR